MSTALSTTAGAITLSGVFLALASLMVLHVLPTGLSPVHNAVSQYGITRYRLGYRVATISLGIAGAAAAAGIANQLRGPTTLPVGLLACFALARLVISWFPMDLPGSDQTSSGRAHMTIALVTFAAIVLASFRLSSLLAGSGQWQAISEAVHVLSYYLLAMAIAMVLCRNSPNLRRNFGAIERGFYLGIFVALALVGAALV